MMRKAMLLILISFLSFNLCGCAVLLAGAAGGLGTAVWLSEKLVQQVDKPFERTVEAAKTALESLNLPITKETVKQDVAQILSEDTDGKKIWIDISRITDSSSKLEIRVGAIKSDKPAAETILTQIQRYL